MVLGKEKEEFPRLPSTMAQDKSGGQTQAKPTTPARQTSEQASALQSSSTSKSVEQSKPGPAVPGIDASQSRLDSSTSPDDLVAAQSAMVYEEVLQHLDWDNVHKDSPPAFQPYILFVHQDVEPVIKDLQSSFKPQDANASRVHCVRGHQKGKAYVIEQEAASKTLQKKLYLAQPRMSFGYDMCEVNGSLQSCRVIC